MGIVLVLLTLGLAFANGANDVSKGIATLVGSGTTKYRAAVLWGTAWTVAGALATPLPALELVAASDCPQETLVRVGLLDSLHWTSAGATSFFRGLNDTPKILALGVAATAGFGISGFTFYALVAAAMGLGSVVGGFRVTETLAKKVTRISHDDGLLANLTTSGFVCAASLWGLPVSTTHVSSGAILGIAAGSKEAGPNWKTVREMLLAWVVTLPVAALVAAVAFRLLA